MRLLTQTVTAAAAVGVAVAAGSAYTAGNATTPVVAVGQAATVTAGFDVSAVDYTLGTGDALASVAFTLTPSNSSAGPATEARVRLVATSTYFDCDEVAGTGKAVVATCTTAGMTAGAVNTLDIVATSN